MTRLASGFWNTFAFRSSLLLLGVVLLVLMGWLERFDWMIYDKISHWRQFSPDNQIVIVAIDEKVSKRLDVGRGHAEYTLS